MISSFNIWNDMCLVFINKWLPSYIVVDLSTYNSLDIISQTEVEYYAC